MRERVRRVEEICGPDRLSELPDSLIFDIFRFLPMTDVVRTTILSTGWKNLWTCFPWLDFKDSMMTDTYKARNFVNRALDSWRGIKILRFNVQFKSKLDKLLTNDIDSWVTFSVENKVEELKLSLPYRYKVSEVKQQLYLVPQNLYSCSSLKDLELKGCELQIHGNVQWDQLKRLTIYSGSLSENAINQVLCGSPQLQSFFLSGHVTKNLSIRSSSLKSLCIGNFSCDATELRIWTTPNLKTLYIFGVPFRKYLLMNVTSLTEVFLEIRDPCLYGNGLFPGNNFVGEALTQILPTIKHVESVILSDSCIKALVAGKEKYMFSPFPNVNFLMLRIGSLELERIVRAVEMFPKLRNLVIVTNLYNSLPKHDESFFEFDKNLPSSFLLQLRRVDVTWTSGDDNIFQLIQFFLKYARCLEKMVLKEEGIKPRTWWNKASQKLLRMEKSSPTAELIFC